MNKQIRRSLLSVTYGLISNSRDLRELERAKKSLKRSRTACEASANARREAAENVGHLNHYNEIPEAPGEFSKELSINHHDLVESSTVTPAAAGPPAAENVARVIFNQS